MLLTDDEVVQLKPWLVKELESISEADSQILSDYVVALLQAEGLETELYANTIENLTDFLGNSTKRFVDQVFSAIKSKKYVPGRVTPIPTKQDNELQARKPPSFNRDDDSQEARTLPRSRKRKHEDFRKSYVDWDAPSTSGDRGKRQAMTASRQRRDIQRDRGHNRSSSYPGKQEDGGEMLSSNSHIGIRHRGALDRLPGDFGSRNQRDECDVASPISNSFPGLPGFSAQNFDPNEAFRAIMTLQAMGFPLPFSDNMANEAAATPKLGSKSQKPCRDYVKNGVCLRGSSCRFQHKGYQVQGDAHDSRSAFNLATDARSKGLSGRALSSKPRRTQSSSNGRTSAQSSTWDVGRSQPSSTIVVTNIPKSNLEEAHVRDFFSSFGTIATIEIKTSDGLALVEYEDRTSAEAAIQSPKSVFDNRFVQVSWYAPDKDEKHTDGEIQDDLNIGSNPPFDRELFEAHTAEAQKKYEARKTLLEQMKLKKQELATKEQEIEILKTTELQKMQDILQTKGKRLPPDLQQALSTLNGHQNTEQLLTQLKALEDEARSLGLDHDSWYHKSSKNHHTDSTYHVRGSHNRGRRGYLARGRDHAWTRGVLPRDGAYNLDNRSRQIRLSTADLNAAQDEHLKQLITNLTGFESLSVDPEPNSKSQIITFSNRRAAEAFYYSSSDIPNVGPATRSWVTARTLTPLAKNGDVEMPTIVNLAEKERQRTTSPEIIAENADQRGQRDDAGYGSEEYEWIV